MSYKEDLTETVGEIVDEKISKSGGVITRNQLRDALANLLDTSDTNAGTVTFRYRYTFEMADAVIRAVREKIQEDQQTLTYAEIKASYGRNGRLAPRDLLKDVQEHRQQQERGEEYKSGIIVVDKLGRMYQRAGDHWLMFGIDCHIRDEVPARPLTVIHEP